MEDNNTRYPRDKSFVPPTATFDAADADAARQYDSLIESIATADGQTQASAVTRLLAICLAKTTEFANAEYSRLHFDGTMR
jgi:hypothetical protein